MNKNIQQPIDLWDINPALGKKIDEISCSTRLNYKTYENIHDYLETQLEAWNLIPKPATQFYSPTGALALEISSLYFKLSCLHKALEWALIAFEARKNIMSVSYPFSLGKIYYELNDFDNAFKYFQLAYELDRYNPFSQNDKKYWIFYKSKKEKSK